MKSKNVLFFKTRNRFSSKYRDRIKRKNQKCALRLIIFELQKLRSLELDDQDDLKVSPMLDFLTGFFKTVDP